MRTCLYDSDDASHLPCVFRPHFSEHHLSEHFDFSKCIPPIELSYDRLSRFSLFCSSHNNSKHHNTNMITFSLSLRAYNYEPFVLSLHHSFDVIHLSSNSNSSTSCHCSTYATRVLVAVHRIHSISSIFYLLLSTVYTRIIIPTVYHLPYIAIPSKTIVL